MRGSPGRRAAGRGGAQEAEAGADQRRSAERAGPTGTGPSPPLPFPSPPTLPACLPPFLPSLFPHAGNWLPPGAADRGAVPSCPRRAGALASPAGEYPAARRTGVWGLGRAPILPISRNFQVPRERASGDTLLGGVSWAPPCLQLELGASRVPEGWARGLGLPNCRRGGGQGGGHSPSRPVSRQRRFSRFLLQMLLLGVVGAAVGRVAGRGGDSLGSRGLLCLVSLLPLFPVWLRLTLRTW